MKAGDYVRTNSGSIWKLDYYDIEGKRWIAYKNDDWIPVYESEIKLSSDNIKDLIEAGDFVNRLEVMDADWINENGEYEEGLAFPMFASDDLDIIENWRPLKYVDIKSIITKERMKEMEYKVNE